MATFYIARSEIITPLLWSTFALPFSVETIAGCMDHPAIRALFNKVEKTEIAPHVKPVPGMTPESYVELIERRFSNPSIVDTTRRVAFDGSSRHTGFLLPILRDSLAAGISVNGLALVEAIWARMCEGTREDGSLIAPNDPYWDALQTAARAAKNNPQAWLKQTHIYGDLATTPRFADAFSAALNSLWANGIVKTIEDYCAKP